ncbi:MAG: type I restriction enzyme HsdR N-terminal domain-containing protein [Flavobacteriales bacterium]|jgi:predicted type IV restriction endonuclease|nr:type I restriction enzyme HsdR N-terminal domain-containing protein [Flavobacteriales bacterium]HJN64494.1 type I restriction enzyme HsdR N-terminal domain-containing protein [Flavobacteriales bacterium]|tara:strand:- start:579 stop:1025 length:447 start_codon:yes stop_codon:yes gene_type:complete
MKMPQLMLPKAALKIKLVEGTTQVFDIVRKKYFVLTPEEWVRQHFIHFLNIEKKYPLGLMRVEKIIKYNNLRTRADIVLYNTDGKPNMIVECKAPNVKITQDSFNQIAKYNFQLRSEFLVVTNGLQHFCCKMEYKRNEIKFVEDIPSF